MTYTTFVENQLGTVHFVVRNGDWEFLNMALFPGTPRNTMALHLSPKKCPTSHGLGFLLGWTLRDISL